ncbi:MAG: trehalase family glycosidase [Bacteroidaceae bacterium]
MKAFLLSFFVLSPLFACGQCYPDAVNPDWQKEIPRVIYPDTALVNLYERTWEIAAGRVRKGPEGLPASPYLDENCYDDQIWIWDACFMVMFSKYAPAAYPGKQTLENLYQPILENRVSPLRVHLRDNPPLFAWTEYNNYVFTADEEHLDYLLNKKYLQRHFDYFNTVKKGDVKPEISPNAIVRDVVRREGQLIGYTWSGGASGMDNTVRGREAGGYSKIMWIDAISQQALSALNIGRLCQLKGKKVEAKLWEERYDSLKKTINERYWDEKDGFYYDVNKETGKACRVQTAASFWAMLAEIPNKKQAARMVETLRNDSCFGGLYPWNSLARWDQDFNAATGDYWRGGVWLPIAYMGTKALEKYGYYELADSLAERVIRQQLNTYKKVTPHTIWECYSPSADLPSTEVGHVCRPDFCGWSALGPISLFIENVLGFCQVDGLNNTLTWRLKADRGTQGIRNLNFGKIRTDLVYDATTKRIEILTNEPYTLTLNAKKYKIKRGIQSIGVK